MMDTPFISGLRRYLTPDQLHRLQNAKVAIIGAGGLGSNCAMHLVRCGFRNLILIDADTVDASNLNRQSFFARQIGMPKVVALAENLCAVNPDLLLTTHHLRVTRDNLRELTADAQAIVEAVDDPATKKMITEQILPLGTLLVSASGIGGYGCSDRIQSRAIRPNFILVGDGQTPCDTATPPFSPLVGMAAALQADAVFTYFMQQSGETS